ncbi:MAG: hypothetical protein JSW61_11495 [Candidatus Thorarchaeota archaeon]|nr:MAG: hypothetical protein JSW61_11495 [Candidatus Thorarchaeota archaeon]
MAQSYTVTKKKGSFRRNVIVTFLLISIISLGATGAVSLFFVDLIGGFTTTESTTALSNQIERSIEQTAEQNALVINQKLLTAESMVRAMAEECEGLFTTESTFRAREVYYDYFFEHISEGPIPTDIEWDPWREVNASFSYSSWYVPGSTPTNYQTYETQHNETLSRVSNLDYIFQYIHNQMPEFRWLYVAFRNNLFINYPGSVVGGTVADRLDPQDQFRAAEEEWYMAIRDGGGEIVYDGPYYDPIDGVLLLSIGRAFYHQNGTLLGIIAGDITVDDIRDKILDVRVLDTGNATLITSDGGIVAHHEVDDSVYAFYEPDLPALEDFEALETAQIIQVTSGGTGIIEFQDSGRDMVLAYAPVGIGGYICTIIVPVEEALAAIPQLESRIAQANTAAISFILMVTIGGIVLAGIVATVVTNQIAKPLQYLMDLAMRNVEAMIKQQDLDTLDLRVDESFMAQDDEIGDLARAFQGMLDTIGEEE